MVAVIFYIITVFFIRDYVMYAAMFVFIIGLTLVAKIPLKVLLRTVRTIVFLVLVTSIINLFFTTGEVLWVHWKFIKIYKEGVEHAIKLALRLTELASTTSFEGLQKHQFTLNFDVPQNTDKYLTVKAELALSDGETAQIQVSGITVNELTVLGLPVDSRPYEYSCDSKLEDCGGDDGGCSIVAAEESNGTVLVAIAAALALLLSALALRTKKN